MSELAHLTKENNYLRGLIPKLTGKCLHCGLEDMGKCASGFPGCAWADDLFVAGDDELIRLLARLQQVESERDRLKESVLEFENREASVCPENTPFEQVIKSLLERLKEAEWLLEHYSHAVIVSKSDEWQKRRDTFLNHKPQ